jgi:hypothetical protein
MKHHVLTCFSRFFITIAIMLGCLPAKSLVRMDNQSIDLALKYGMQNQNMGFSTLLGPNWIEGPKGMLVNVYSPFMLIAARAAQSGLPEAPTDKDIAMARNKLGKYIRDFRDPQIRHKIKFSVSFYGDTPDFGSKTSVYIEGFGRGKSFKLTPVKEIRDLKANLVNPQVASQKYEAYNAYYFDFDAIAVLEEYTLVVEQPGQSPVEFRIQNNVIY